MQLNKQVIYWLDATFGADSLESNVLLLWCGQVAAALGLFQIGRMVLGFTTNEKLNDGEPDDATRKLGLAGSETQVTSSTDSDE